MTRHRPSGHVRVRRVRLAMETRGDVVVVRRKSSRPMPSNWRELLADALPSAAEARSSDERKRKGAAAQPSAFVMPGVMIQRPEGDNKPWSMAFSIPWSSPTTSGYRRMFAQRMAVDRAIEELDVRFIPLVGNPKIRMKNNQMYVTTELRSNPRYVGHGRSTLVPTDLKGITGLNHRHIKVYVASGGFLGLATTCPDDSDCDCKNVLPRVWEKAWRM